MQLEFIDSSGDLFVCDVGEGPSWGGVSVSSIGLGEIGVSWGKECFKEEISFVFVTYHLFFSSFCYWVFDLECWDA